MVVNEALERGMVIGVDVWLSLSFSLMTRNESLSGQAYHTLKTNALVRKCFPIPSNWGKMICNSRYCIMGLYFSSETQASSLWVGFTTWAQLRIDRRHFLRFFGSRNHAGFTVMWAAFYVKAILRSNKKNKYLLSIEKRTNEREKTRRTKIISL